MYVCVYVCKIHDPPIICIIWTATLTLCVTSQRTAAKETIHNLQLPQAIHKLKISRESQYLFTYCQITRTLVGGISECGPVIDKYIFLLVSHPLNSFSHTSNYCASWLNSMPDLLVCFIFTRLECLVRTCWLQYSYLIRWFHDVFEVVDRKSCVFYSKKSGEICRVGWYRYKNREPVASSENTAWNLRTRESKK